MQADLWSFGWHAQGPSGTQPHSGRGSFGWQKAHSGLGMDIVWHCMYLKGKPWVIGLTRLRSWRQQRSRRGTIAVDGGAVALHRLPFHPLAIRCFRFCIPWPAHFLVHCLFNLFELVLAHLLLENSSKKIKRMC